MKNRLDDDCAAVHDPPIRDPPALEDFCILYRENTFVVFMCVWYADNKQHHGFGV